MGFDNKKVIYAMVLLVTAIWSVTFVSTKVLLEYLSPTEILVYRYVIAYAVFMLISPKPVRLSSPKEEAIFALCGTTGVSLYFLMENSALYYSTAANVSLIVSTAQCSPVWWRTSSPKKRKSPAVSSGAASSGWEGYF